MAAPRTTKTRTALGARPRVLGPPRWLPEPNLYPVEEAGHRQPLAGHHPQPDDDDYVAGPGVGKNTKPATTSKGPQMRLKTLPYQDVWPRSRRTRRLWQRVWKRWPPSKLQKSRHLSNALPIPPRTLPNIFLV